MKIIFLLSCVLISEATIFPHENFHTLLRLLLGNIPNITKPFQIPSIQMPSILDRGNSHSSVCIFSTDPTQYEPKCFLCPNSAYPSILETCSSASPAPNNVSFNQALCLERNCAINYPENPSDSISSIRVKRQTSDYQPNSYFSNHAEKYSISNVPLDSSMNKKRENKASANFPTSISSKLHLQRHANSTVSPTGNLRDAHYQIDAPVLNKSITPTHTFTIRGTKYEVTQTKMLHLLPEDPLH